MKNIACYLLLLVFSQTAFAQSKTEKQEKNTFEYAEGVNFTVLTLKRARGYSSAGLREYKADKGYEFVSMILEFKNESGADVEIDFSNFGILDDDQQKHALFGVMQAYKVTSTDQKFTFTLNKGKEKKYILAFKPVSKNVLVNKLINGTEIFTLSPFK